jgi:hypothetical protein
LALSAVKQEASEGTSAPKQEKESGEEKEAVTSLGLLANPMDLSDHKSLVDDLVLRPKMEKMNENSGDYVEVDFDWKQQLGGDFCGLISQGSMQF